LGRSENKITELKKLPISEKITHLTAGRELSFFLTEKSDCLTCGQNVFGQNGHGDGNNNGKNKWEIEKINLKNCKIKNFFINAFCRHSFIVDGKIKKIKNKKYLKYFKKKFNIKNNLKLKLK
jgi:alpha-tubulin suppressor-like RCC1 family protein